MPEARFVPGEIVTDRYRIVALLGRGGMGEVYRADDLKLGTQVALKFLPPALAGDPDYRERFLDEVRLARQVSHANICRVHDVGEVAGHNGDGLLFLSMEYVPGEDLASLLRRIGRLPQEKANEIARQMCLGLAAAHDQGILHRDLKPGNVMVDGEGRARIADFGLAAAASSVRGAAARVGTPAYMAPEQLDGREVSAASDIFSLGLVLFELFTGKPAYRAQTIEDLQRQHRQTDPTPSSILPDIHPAADAIIRRCLQREPGARPKNAREVALALPGGDPVAAALAAGETPSLQLIAASARSGTLSLGVGVMLLAIIAGGMWFVGQFERRAQLLEIIQPELPPDVLEHRARELGKQFGYEVSGDSARGFDLELPAPLRQDSVDRRDRLRDPAFGALRFWFRRSPGPLVPVFEDGRVRFQEPPIERRGMFNVVLSFDGSLLFFRGVPQPQAKAAPAADFAAAFAAAKLSPDQLREVPPEFVPAGPATVLAAWQGAHPRSDAEVKVEAAAFGSMLTWFDVKVTPRVTTPRPPPTSQLATTVLWTSGQVFSVVVLCGGLWFGVRNLRLGRGDRRTATRIALYLFAVTMLCWALRADYVDFAGTVRMAIRQTGVALWIAVLAWFGFLAIEPTLRRAWPEKLVAWSRLLTGQFRDPLVGRALLIGMATAFTVMVLALANWYVTAWWTGRSPHASLFDSDNLAGTRYVLGSLLWTQVDAGIATLVAVFLLALLRNILKRSALVVLAFALLILARMPYVVQTELGWVDLAFRLLQVAAVVACLVGDGALALFFMILTLSLLGGSPMAPNFGAWWSTSTLLVWTAIFAMAGFGWFTAVRRRAVA
jgi:serine/threonine-protein kinase